MIRYTAVLLGAMLLIRSASARIGETPKQIEVRYGHPLAEFHTSATDLFAATYVSGGFNISVYFLDGKSQSESYQKQGLAQDFSDNEIELLLKASGHSKPWVTTTSTDLSVRAWACTDGTTLASYPKASLAPILLIFTAKMQDRSHEDAAKHERENLKGF